MRSNPQGPLHTSSVSSRAEPGADFLVDALAVGVLASQPGHRGLHHLPDVLRAQSFGIRCGSLRNRRLYRAINFLIARGRGQVTFYDLDFRLFLAGQFFASALTELLRRVVPLLDERSRSEERRVGKEG